VTAPRRRRTDLGAVLRTLRLVAGLSQRELAQRAGLPETTVSSIESGTTRDPRFGTVERLAAAAGGRVAVLSPDGSSVQARRPPVIPDERPRFDWWDRQWGDARARDRLRRDRHRWAAAGERPIAPGTSVHRLLPGDEHLLDTVSPADAAAYLGDPSVYHWVVAYEHRGIRGHLAAYRQRSPRGLADRLLVHEVRLRGPRQAPDGLAGVLLVGALIDEARRAGIPDVWALVSTPEEVDFLGALGFTPRQSQPAWWELPG